MVVLETVKYCVSIVCYIKVKILCVHSLAFKIIKINRQRGGRRGQRGEGLSGTTIKDTRTKQRGRVEAREGGGFGWGGGRDGEKMHTTVTEQ